MYQNANSCTIALSEAGTALFEGGTLSKTHLDPWHPDIEVSDFDIDVSAIS
jgi:hypothetical protein